jgi:predicted DsbA family dithiol-disulfide isomerase
MTPVRFTVWSDYLCPWCYNASVRLRRIEDEFGDAVEVEWRSYLLRPHPRPDRSLEKFVGYTQSWLRPAAEEDAGQFRVWQTREGPPSHSVPPHVAAKAAARVGPEAFRALHDRLLRAYFAENRDVSDEAVLRALWRELALPGAAVPGLEDPELVEQILAEHRDALEIGVNGVPAVQRTGNPAFIVGAQPLETYRRWVERSLEGVA